MKSIIECMLVNSGESGGAESMAAEGAEGGTSDPASAVTMQYLGNEDEYDEDEEDGGESNDHDDEDTNDNDEYANTAIHGNHSASNKLVIDDDDYHQQFGPASSTGSNSTGGNDTDSETAGSIAAGNSRRKQNKPIRISSDAIAKNKNGQILESNEANLTSQAETTTGTVPLNGQTYKQQQQTSSEQTVVAKKHASSNPSSRRIKDYNGIKTGTALAPHIASLTNSSLIQATTAYSASSSTSSLSLGTLPSSSASKTALSETQCGFCLTKFDELEALKNHIYKDHIELIINTLVRSTPAGATSSASANGVSPSSPKSSTTDSSSSSSSSTSSSSGVSSCSSRASILSAKSNVMDSFCRICQKEVCNKYFLKSHLQNKHGVQLEDYIAMYFPNAVNSLTSNGTSQTTQQQPVPQMTPEQQQAAALVAAAVANELIENHAQSLNLNTLNQVVAAKLITNSANRLATSTGAASTNSSSPDPFVKSKLVNGSSTNVLNKPIQNRNTPLANLVPQLNESSTAFNNSSGQNFIGQDEGADEDTEEDRNEEAAQNKQTITTNGNPAEYYKQLMTNADIDPSSVSDINLFNHYLNLALQQQQKKQGGADLSVDPAALLASSSAVASGATSSPFASKYSMLTQQSSGTPSSGNEDYCELCQKQFCNKYYLKKHKLDVHGVTVITNSETATPNTPPPTMLAKANNINTKLAAASPQINGSSHHRLSSSQTISSILAVSALNNKNAAITTTASATASPLISNLGLNRALVMNEANIKCEQAQDVTSGSIRPDSEDDTVKVATVNLSGNGATILNKLPLGGTEVKCDKCTKVFYNLEYLTLHKINKHGAVGLSERTINMSPATLNPLAAIQPTNKENSSLSSGGFHSRSSTSLIKTEATASSSSSSPASNFLQTEAFCEYCNKSFCNKYFLRTHMSKAHGKTLIIENNSNNTIISTLFNGGDGVTGESISMNQQLANYPDEDLNLNETYVASKVVDRVVCDICNKQVCNKYFLRTHKQKVHGIFEPSSHSGHQSSPASNSQTNAASATLYSDLKPEMEMETADEYEAGPEAGGDPAYDDDETGANGYDGEIIHEKELGECERAAGASNGLATHGIQSSMRRCSESSQNSNGSSFAGGGAGGSSSSITQVTHTGSDLGHLPAGSMDFENSYCHLCKRKFYSYNFLRNHATKIHGISLPKRVRNGNNTPTHPLSNNEVDENGVTMDIDQGENAPSEFDETQSGLKSASKKRKRQLDSIYALASQLGSAGGAADQNGSGPSAISNLLAIINMNLMKNLDCQLCNQAFTSPIELQQHVVDIHKMKYEDYLSKIHVNVLMSDKKKGKNGKLKANKRQRRNSANSTISSMSNKTTGSSYASSDMSKVDMVAHKKTRPGTELDAENSSSDYDHNDLAFQAFMIENDSDSNQPDLLLQPCLVYLPVKSRVTETITAKFTLKPVANDMKNRRKRERLDNDERPPSRTQDEEETEQNEVDTASEENQPVGSVDEGIMHHDTEQQEEMQPSTDTQIYSEEHENQEDGQREQDLQENEEDDDEDEDEDENDQPDHTAIVGLPLSMQQKPQEAIQS